MKTLVFVDCIEGWQECLIVKVIGDRATVRTESGTTLNRSIKIVKNESELMPDRCIYILKEDS